MFRAAAAAVASLGRQTTTTYNVQSSIASMYNYLLFWLNYGHINTWNKASGCLALPGLRRRTIYCDVLWLNDWLRGQIKTGIMWYILYERVLNLTSHTLGDNIIKCLQYSTVSVVSFDDQRYCLTKRVGLGWEAIKWKINHVRYHDGFFCGCGW